MQRIDQEELARVAQNLPEWDVSAAGLVREARFADFKDALAFVNRAGALAEAAGHHPDIDIRYNRVRLALVTHDAGGVTEADVRMARRLNDELLRREPSIANLSGLANDFS